MHEAVCKENSLALHLGEGVCHTAKLVNVKIRGLRHDVMSGR